MVSSLSAAGLTIDSLATLIASLTQQMQAIYGTDINVASNSPDGQLLNIFCQTAEDTLELIQAVYASFGYMTAYGTQLDQRLAILGIARRAGTYTTTPVLISVNQALTLYGLDQTVQPVYTLRDTAGNQYQLLVTKVFGGAGIASLLFQASNIGMVQVNPNTITQQVTTVLGVLPVNNPLTSIVTTGHTASGLPQITLIPATTNMVAGQNISGAGIPVGSTILSVDSGTQVTISANATATASGVTITVVSQPVVTGTNEETDTQFKVRAAQSFALASTGPADAIEAALLNIASVTDALVIENPTNMEVDTVPAFSIWCIVADGTDDEIGQAIYAKKAPGCAMKGSQSDIVSRPNGTTFTALWDTALAESLYISFGILWRGAIALSNDDIITALAAALVYKLGQNPNVGDIVTAMATIAPTAVVIFGSNQGVSDDGVTFDSLVNPTTAQYYFTVEAGNITIS